MPQTVRDPAQRRKELHGLLRAGTVSTQHALVAALRARGIPATQSSVSRPTGGRPEHSDEMTSVADLVRELKPAGASLLVIRTRVGAAQRVALALDRAAWPEIVGCIGGDDTVFVATAGLATQKQLPNRIEQALSSR